MGIDSNWKEICREKFGWPTNSPSDPKPTVVVDDLCLGIWTTFRGVTTWQEWGERFCGRVRAFTDAGDLTAYYVLLDESAGVPRNKNVTQRIRDARQRHPPFTEAEQATIHIGAGPIPQPSVEFFYRLMATRAMHRSLYEFVAASMATIALPSTTRLILDGFRACGIVQRKVAGEALTFSGILDPVDGTEIMSEADVDRINSPSIIHINKNHTGRGNSVMVRPSSGVGESDLKILAVINQQEPGSTIFVRSHDGDMFPIFLLHMRGLICASPLGEGTVPYGSVKYSILLDTQSPNRKPGSPPVPVLDIVQMWRNIMNYFQLHFASRVPFPAETMAMLMLITGSDYVKRQEGDKVIEGFPMIGAKTLWKNFNHNTAIDILFPRGRSNEAAVIADEAIGQMTKHVAIGVSETSLAHFVAFMYWSLAGQKGPFPTRAPYNLEVVRDTRRQVEENVKRMGKKVTTLNSWIPPSDDLILLTIRELGWNLHYFSNGDTPTPFMDPFAVDESTGISIHGWMMQDGKAVVSDRVYVPSA